MRITTDSRDQRKQSSHQQQHLGQTWTQIYANQSIVMLKTIVYRGTLNMSKWEVRMLMSRDFDI